MSSSIKSAPSHRRTHDAAAASADAAEEHLLRAKFVPAMLAARDGLRRLGGGGAAADDASPRRLSSPPSVLCDAGRWILARDAGHERDGGSSALAAGGAQLHERLVVVMLQSAFEVSAVECRSAVATAERFFSADGTRRFSFAFGFKWLEISLAMGDVGAVAAVARALLPEIDAPPPTGEWAAQYALILELLAVHALPRLGRAAEGVALVERAPLEPSQRTALLARCEQAAQSSGVASADGGRNVKSAPSTALSTSVKGGTTRGGERGSSTSSAAKAMGWAATLLASLRAERGKQALQLIAACSLVSLLVLLVRKFRPQLAALIASGRGATAGLITELKQIAVGA